MPQGIGEHLRIEGAMATKQHGQIVETPTEARQAEPGPSVFALLTCTANKFSPFFRVLAIGFFRT